jgi:hypothetical protein
LLIPTPNGFQLATVAEQIRIHPDRARELNREILDFAAYLASDVIEYVEAIERHGSLISFRGMVTLSTAKQIDGLPSVQSLSIMAGEVFDYLQLVDRLDEYRYTFLETTERTPSFLIAGSERSSDAIPLLRHMNREG